jgi:two-component system cell cycle sensor histidine kinase/response regulator CckA
VNAVDSMTGPGRITLETSNIDKSPFAHPAHGTRQKYVCLTVRDSGKGIEMRNINRIFQSGFSTKRGESRGNGLSIVHSIVKEYDGFIECSSVPGEGTEFRVYLPACE